MQNAIIFEKEIELLGKKYKVYLKRVPTRISKREVISTTIKAFVKRIDADYKTTNPYFNKN